jgi:hypothetical protein
MRSGAVVLLSLAGVGVASAFGYLSFRAGERAASAAAPAASASPVAPPPGAEVPAQLPRPAVERAARTEEATPGQGQSMRARFVAEAEQRGATLRTEQDLDQALIALEKRARDQGQVTAMEVETGILLIDRMRDVLPPGATIEKRAAFMQRMQALSLETPTPASSGHPLRPESDATESIEEN